MQLLIDLTNYVDNKNKKAFVLYFNCKLIKIIYKVNLIDLEHLEHANIWISSYVLFLLIGIKPYLHIKKYKKTYLKHSFAVSTIFVSNEFKKFIYFCNIINFCKNKTQLHLYFKKLVTNFKIFNIFYIKNFEIKAEFFKWNNIVYGELIYNFNDNLILSNLFKSYYKFNIVKYV